MASEVSHQVSSALRSAELLSLSLSVLLSESPLSLPHAASVRARAATAIPAEPALNRRIDVSHEKARPGEGAVMMVTGG